jgi:hypothetical protein
MPGGHPMTTSIHLRNEAHQQEVMDVFVISPEDSKGERTPPVVNHGRWSPPSGGWALARNARSRAILIHWISYLLIPRRFESPALCASARPRQSSIPLSDNPHTAR